MRRYRRELTINTDFEEIDTDELLLELLDRPDVSAMESDKMRRLIVKLMGLPDWYHSDKEALCREILKLF